MSQARAAAPIRKYEFVEGDTVTTWDGRTLRRIRALIAIGAFIAPGTLGGYIEAEKNLDPDPQVSGNAWVSGNAQVSGDAQVYGDAWVSGNAQVSGDAWVSGNAWVYGSGLIFWASIVGTENGTLTVYNGRDNTLLVTRGCFSGTVDQFLAKSADVHDDRVRREYELLIEVARSRIEHAREVTPAPTKEGQSDE